MEHGEIIDLLNKRAKAIRKAHYIAEPQIEELLLIENLLSIIERQDNITKYINRLMRRPLSKPQALGMLLDYITNGSE